MEIVISHKENRGSFGSEEATQLIIKSEGEEKELSFKEKQRAMDLIDEAIKTITGLKKKISEAPHKE